MNTYWHIAIVIPARDEEELLPGCLRSVQNARRMLPSNLTSDLIVVADQSTDGTLEIARSFIQENGTVVETKWVAWEPLVLSERGAHWSATMAPGIAAGWPTRTLTARCRRPG
jgi:cellulose synthase/poly-beta-1,6-N-acetylglucosamine synthase-like glycosyltransferase